MSRYLLCVLLSLCAGFALGWLTASRRDPAPEPVITSVEILEPTPGRTPAYRRIVLVVTRVIRDGEPTTVARPTDDVPGWLIRLKSADHTTAVHAE